MGLTLSLVTAFTLILGIQVINIYVVNAATLDTSHLINIKGYEPPNEGGPDSSQGSGTR